MSTTSNENSVSDHSIGGGENDAHRTPTWKSSSCNFSTICTMHSPQDQQRSAARVGRVKISVMSENLISEAPDFKMPVSRSFAEKLQRLSRLQTVSGIQDSRPALKEFTIFSELPRELRNRIVRNSCVFVCQKYMLTRAQWEFAASEPRIIKLLAPDTAPGSPIFRSSKSSMVQGQAKHPGILHATQESRFEGLRLYTSCHEKIRQHPVRVRKYAVNTIFINFNVDLFIVQSVDLNTGSWSSPMPSFSKLNFDVPSTAKIVALARNFEIHLPCPESDLFMKALEVLHLYRMLGDQGRSIQELNRVDVCFDGAILNQGQHSFVEIEQYKDETEAKFKIDFRMIFLLYSKREIFLANNFRLPNFLWRYGN